jgi:hypothetical protein
MTRPRPAGGERTLSIADLLRAAGFVSAETATLARSKLEANGLTRSGKTGISSAKEERAHAVLDAAFASYCGEERCHELLDIDGRQPIVVARRSCEVCGGSNNQRAVREMIGACEYADVEKVLVVGGTPRLEEALQSELSGSTILLRVIIGTENEPNQREAIEDCRWADLVVVWAPTPLPHKVSRLYTSELCQTDLVEVHRRGLEALAHAVTDHLRARPGYRVKQR